MEPTALIAAGLGSNFLTALVTRLISRRGEVREQEHTESRDTQADWARFSGEIRGALEEERRHAMAQHAESQKRLTELRERLDEGDEEMRAYEAKARAHVTKLESHIWAQLPPPPPERPEGM